MNWTEEKINQVISDVKKRASEDEDFRKMNARAASLYIEISLLEEELNGKIKIEKGTTSSPVVQSVALEGTFQAGQHQGAPLSANFVETSTTAAPINGKSNT